VDVPRPTRTQVEALAGAITDDEWLACEAIVEREAADGIEVTDRYLAHAIEQLRG
jgi:hypothetical protein